MHRIKGVTGFTAYTPDELQVKLMQDAAEADAAENVGRITKAQIRQAEEEARKFRISGVVRRRKVS